MHRSVLLLPLFGALAACSWVDSSGRQTNAAPDNNNQVASGVEGKSLVLDFNALDKDGNIESVELTELNQGPAAAVDCTGFSVEQTADTLIAACQASESNCAFALIEDEQTKHRYTAQLPELRKPYAYRYQAVIKDTDGATATNITTLCLDSTPEPPKATPDAYQVEYGQTLNVPGIVFGNDCKITQAQGVLSNDDDDFDYREGPALGKPCLAAEIASTPSAGNGFQLNADGSFSYTPSTNQAIGSKDSFSYYARDGFAHDVTATPATVALTVSGTNAPPVAKPGLTFSAIENTPLDIEVTELAEDPEGGSLQITAVTAQPINGEVTLGTGQPSTITYTPPNGFTGPESFSVNVQDAGQANLAINIDVNVDPANTAPSASVTTPHATPLVAGGSSGDWILAVSDAETTNPANLTTSVASSDPAVATAAITAGQNTANQTVTVTPVGAGNATVTFTVADAGLGLQPSLTHDLPIAVTVQAAPNTPPVINDESIRWPSAATPVSQPFVISATDAQDPSANLTLTIASTPTHGSLNASGTIASGTTVIYTRPGSVTEGFTDSFTVTAEDTGSLQNTATYTVTVNTLPVASNPAGLTVVAGGNAIFSAAQIASDADSDTLLLGNPVASLGSAALDSGDITVNANGLTNGQTITVTFDANDGLEQSTGLTFDVLVTN